MNLDSKLLEAFKNFTFEESEQDKYFKDRLRKLKFDDYNNLMKRYILKAALEGSVDMTEFDRDIDELLDKIMTIEKLDQDIEAQKEITYISKVDTTGYFDENGEYIKRVKSEVEENTDLCDWIHDIYYLRKQVDNIYEILNKNEKVIEEEIDSLDGIVYVSPILEKGAVLSPPMIKVGTVDESRIVDFFPIETNAPIVPSLYKPDFYYVGIGSEERWKANSVEPSAMYKKFTPKNKINQILITKEDVTYTTGYIDSNGVAIYYDQLPKH